MRVTISILLLSMLLTAQATAQTADMAEIDRLTARAMKHLTTFSRYSYTAQAYGDMEFGKNFGSDTVTVYFGEITGVERASVVRSFPIPKDKYGLWVNRDHVIHTKEADGITAIYRHHVPWVSQAESDHFASSHIQMGHYHFFFPNSAKKYVLSLNPDSWPLYERPGTVTTITEETHRGRPCYKVVVTPPASSSPSQKVITSEYLLDKQHGMVLRKKESGLLHIPKGSRSGGVLDVEQVTEVSYGPPTENGLPFPTAVKGWYVWPTGRREPMTDVEFTEFRRYTPTADELDFQKQFGIPLPALPPKPSGLVKMGSSRVTRWLAVGLGITVVAAVVVYALRRSRRLVLNESLSSSTGSQ